MALSRRVFLSSSVATATTFALASRVLGANERVGVAVIGVNGMGHAHVKTLSARKDVNFVAFCDIDPAPLARAAKTVRDAGGAESRRTPRRMWHTSRAG
jgi:ornithine cyclodeaminase/alanine dehydrogenase-like protein (mu-crystallin family)